MHLYIYWYWCSKNKALLVGIYIYWIQFLSSIIGLSMSSDESMYDPFFKCKGLLRIKVPVNRSEIWGIEVWECMDHNFLLRYTLRRGVPELHWWQTGNILCIYWALSHVNFWQWLSIIFVSSQFWYWAVTGSMIAIFWKSFEIHHKIVSFNEFSFSNKIFSFWRRRMCELYFLLSDSCY